MHRFFLAPLAVLLFLGVLPTVWAGIEVSGRGLPFFSAYFQEVWLKNPLVLIFGLAAGVPYVWSFSGLVENRFLAYTRTRREIRQTLMRHVVFCSLVTFVTFFLIGVFPAVWGWLFPPAYRPEMLGFDSPQRLAQAEAEWMTFSQLVPLGPWVMPVAFGVWLGVNAALFGTVTMASVLLIPHRFLALTLPWIFEFLLTFALAHLSLESFSYGLIVPFNLTQLPLANLLFPLGSLLVLTAVCMGYVLIASPGLRSLQ